MVAAGRETVCFLQGCGHSEFTHGPIVIHILAALSEHHTITKKKDTGNWKGLVITGMGNELGQR